MKLVLLTTTDVPSGRQADFERMIASVKTGAAPGADPVILALLQRANEDDRSRCQDRMPAGSIVLSCPKRLSLSEARNRLLAAAHEQALTGEDCVLGFPDDDCWYRPGFVGFLAAAFGGDPQLDMLACRVSLDPVDASPIGPGVVFASVRQIVRRSSSNSIFFRGSTVAAVGYFDRSLGLGTSNVSGEDTDYALRGLLRARRAAFLDLPLVGHRESDLASVARYFKGSLIVLGRHGTARPALLFEYMRKLAIGLCLVLLSRLSPQQYWSASRASLREMGEAVWSRARRRRGASQWSVDAASQVAADAQARLAASRPRAAAREIP